MCRKLSCRLIDFFNGEWHGSRREIVFDTLLLLSMGLFVTGRLIGPFTPERDAIAPLFFFLLAVCCFVTAYILSRTGCCRIWVYGLIASLFILALFIGKRQGVELGGSLLTDCLVIVMAGVLVGSRNTLRNERDKLAIELDERTDKLKRAQFRQIAQLYRFAEFGRLSSGLFHDIMSPLTAVSLNLEQAASAQGNSKNITTAQTHLQEALLASQQVERFISAVKKQIGKRGERSLFSITDETRDVIRILSYKARKAGVELQLLSHKNIFITGDPVRWSQALLNLITNGIDAYDGVPEDQVPRTVVIELVQTKPFVRCTVTDYGIGIKKEDQEIIFEPFYTTKVDDPTKGTGIGLSMVKKILEEDFDATMVIDSTVGKGSSFSFTIATHSS